LLDCIHQCNTTCVARYPRQGCPKNSSRFLSPVPDLGTGTSLTNPNKPSSYQLAVSERGGYLQIQGSFGYFRITGASSQKNSMLRMGPGLEFDGLFLKSKRPCLLYFKTTIKHGMLKPYTIKPYIRIHASHRFLKQCPIFGVHFPDLWASSSLLLS
jgi:hypothetical protein